jgi:ABC-type oligopeptide transport system substrate-binding subunit
MRALLSKTVAASMIAGAALLVSACESETTAVVENTTETPVENMGAEDDMMTTIDAANGTEMNMMDNMTDGNMAAGNMM